MQVHQERSKVPVPRIIAYETEKYHVGAPFMILEFLLADTTMDFVDDPSVTRDIPQRFKARYYAEMAAVQVCSRYLTRISRPVDTLLFK